MFGKLLLISLTFVLANAADEGVKFSMRNLCGETIRIYWVGFKNELVPQTQLPAKNSSSVSINSYRTHRFLVWYNRGKDEEQIQKDAREYGKLYTVGDTNDIVTIEKDLVFIRHDAPQRSLEASEHAVRSCDPRRFEESDGKFDLDCVKSNIMEWLESRRDELDFEWSVYRNLKKGLEYYQCKEEDSAMIEMKQDDENKKGGECINMAAIIGDGEKELGSARGRDDTPIPRKDVEVFINRALDICHDEFYDNMVDETLKAFQMKKTLDEGLKKIKFDHQSQEQQFKKKMINDNEKKNEDEKEVNDENKKKSGNSLWSRVFGSGEDNVENAGEEEEAPYGISGVVLGSAAPSPSPVLPSLLPHAREWVNCMAIHGVSPDFSQVSREISRVRNAKGKIAETLRNQTCLDDSYGTVGVPEDEYTFDWTAPVSDFYSGDYDDQTGTQTVHYHEEDDDVPSSQPLSNPDEKNEDGLSEVLASSSPAYASSFGPPPSASLNNNDQVPTAVQEKEEELIGSGRGGIGSSVVRRGRQGRTREVTQLLNRNNAGVWLIDDFLSDEECDHMVNSARPGLRRATVNEEGNNQAVSQYRNSQAANLMANWRNKSDPIARITRRIFAFANDVTGYGLTVDGQEPFSVIQYNHGQEYRPHCDGSCDGSPHLHAGRVATMLMYCRVAESGGGTSFTKAGVHIKPKAGQAAFFAYKGRNDTMDTELTEHSGCPVAKGEKWVITQWLRLGVGKGESWTKFDPIGGRL